MTLESILNNFWQSFANFWNNVLDFFDSLGSFFSSVWDVIVSVCSFLISLFWFIFYGLRTLISWVYNLFNFVVDSDVWIQSVWALTKVWDYIWWPAVLFILALMTLAIWRTLFSFVIRIMKWNDSYTTMNKKIENQKAMWEKITKEQFLNKDYF